MGAAGDIRQSIKEIIFNNEEIYSVVGKVKNIDEDKRICDVEPISENAEILEVRFQASLESTEGVVCIPKNESLVVVTFLNKNTGFVSQMTEIDKVLINAPELFFDGVEGNKTTFEINGGQNGGLINISDLVNKINALENTLNSLIQSYNTHIHTTTATISASPTPGVISPTTSQGPSAIQPTTQVSDIEDTNVTH